MDDFTRLSKVYDTFFSKVTDDMYMELTYEDTLKMVQEILDDALPWFEFPRKKITYSEHTITTVIMPAHLEVNEETGLSQLVPAETETETFLAFDRVLTQEEINIIATYMVVEWLGQQLASVELVRMKYSGSDFKFTSQANHMQKLIQQKKEYERVGFHLQRLYKRRKINDSGEYVSTISEIMTSSEQQQRGVRHHGFHKI